MKLRVRFVLLLLVVSFGCTTSAFAQLRLDVAVEGPWLLYVEPKFTTSTGTLPVLVAIAPHVPGHNYPVFSAGDGTQVSKKGIYCVGFDHNCTANNTSSLSYGGYADPRPVDIQKPSGWDWTKLSSSAYVFILPMPDSYSADGMYTMSFQKSFPTPTTPATTTETGAHDLGVHLHYIKGPQQLNLFSCTGSPSTTTCSAPASADQDNSGTLRMVISSQESSVVTDGCDYHAHRAYHKMLQLLDPGLSINAQKAYINVPNYDSCSPCDPQQDVVPSDCGAMSMSTTGGSLPMTSQIPERLGTLVNFLKGLNLTSKQNEQIHVSHLEMQFGQLRGRFPSQSQLAELQNDLRSSQAGIHGLLLTDTSGTTRSLAPSLRLNLEMAASEEQDLSRADDLVALSIISGKDCRAAVMLIH